ncbi:RNA-binding S4 domain-containing protein [Schaalia suimastitidis]|uniref:RNA-binding S4 domain-containing protein n=1 Tax=Schaalia suimastitidis TaxID=121163 RepID=UPI00041323A7|nr:RNA-binding S4 domain-containing protein [Schaalia suimastitidis]
MSDIPTVTVSGTIRLGQFLKLAHLAPDGAWAREFIQAGDVLVNGQVETRRGYQLPDGAIVEVHSPAGYEAARLSYDG